MDTKFNPSSERTIAYYVRVVDAGAIPGHANISVCAEATGRDYTEVRLRSTTTDATIAMTLSGHDRRKLIEALLDEQEKYD